VTDKHLFLGVIWIFLRLRKLDTVTEQRLEMLKRLPTNERDTYEAIKWIGENREKFRLPILEPACIGVTVQRGYGPGVEECFNFGQLKVRWLPFWTSNTF
jgi:hypothetical protein